MGQSVNTLEYSGFEKSLPSRSVVSFWLDSSVGLDRALQPFSGAASFLQEIQSQVSQRTTRGIRMYISWN